MTLWPSRLFLLMLLCVGLLGAGCGEEEQEETAASAIPPEVRQAVSVDRVGPGVELPPSEIEAAYHEEVTRLLGEELAGPPGGPFLATVLVGGPVLLASEPCCGVTSLSEATPEQAFRIFQRATIAVTERLAEEVDAGALCCTVNVSFGEDLQGQLDSEASFREELDPESPCCEILSAVSPAGEELDPDAIEAGAAEEEQQEEETEETAPEEEGEGEEAAPAPGEEAAPAAPSEEAAPPQPAAPEGEPAP